MCYDEPGYVFIVPDDFNTDIDRKEFFRKESETVGLKLCKNGWPIASRSEAACNRHYKSMIERFGETKWEYA